MDDNTLAEWSDGDDSWIFDVDENTLWEWSDSDDDEIIRNIVDENPLGEWSDSDGDEIIRNIEENDQTGRGEKRKSDDVPTLPEEDFYTIENKKQIKSKKFRMAAMDYTVRFNNVVSDLDLIESHHRTQAIIEHLLNDVTAGMNEQDQVRFVLRSEQLDTPISMPFMPVVQLTPERVFSQIERVIQSNRDFRLNDTVVVDVAHVEAPQGSGGGKPRRILNIKEFLHKKKSVIVIRNNDDLCLARALVVAIAKIEKDPGYKHIKDPERKVQEKKARELHELAKVPLGPCGLPEVELFQKYLTKYEINIVSTAHNSSIIYPPKPSTNNATPIYLHLHENHYDVITSMPGFLTSAYFCHSCRKAYSNKHAHLCEGMCKSCRAYDCTVKDPVVCNLCKRWFKSKACYDRHKEPIGAARSVCEAIKKCEKCGKSMEVRQLNSKKHICGKKCSTCGIVLNEKEEHKCYIQKTEQKKERQYSELLFFDLECTQEDGTHKANLCIVHNEKGHEWLFQGNTTITDFCEWLFTEEHLGCIVVANNFQGYDGYFIQNYLNQNAVKYEVILRGAKILSMTVPMFKMKFIDSLNFIPMSLAKFPKTFGMTELCKGYFPHLFNKEENQNYVGPIPPQPYHAPKTMKPETREAFLVWYKEQKDNEYVFDFNKEIINYCRSDVDILRKCCMEFREMLLEITDIDPFENCLTIASACHEVYRANFLKEDTIAVFERERVLKDKQSIMAMKWLSYEMERNGIHVVHVRNGGEKRIGKYSVDGYCEEFHTVYEFQGCFLHGKTRKITHKVREKKY